MIGAPKIGAIRLSNCPLLRPFITWPPVAGNLRGSLTVALGPSDPLVGLITGTEPGVGWSLMDSSILTSAAVHATLGSARTPPTKKVRKPPSCPQPVLITCDGTISREKPAKPDSCR